MGTQLVGRPTATLGASPKGGCSIKKCESPANEQSGQQMKSGILCPFSASWSLRFIDERLQQALVDQQAENKLIHKMDERAALYLQMDQTEKGSNALDEGIRIQAFRQIEEDRSKAFNLDKSNQLQKYRLREAGRDDWQQFYGSGSGRYNISQI
ncbi:hypothetical protein llap_8143 [Limosa lapponica baueri]|uniref:Uncharacterized protein n=1 Tax=Limosa lapponica baueri TaxID=1758121 RepID=A0A2I0U628_LIMLA|nr:hypothetical protein llap_8143 [Limosa lapponica baueri]